MNVITFGSCLSRFTANNLVKIFGGKVVSSVYHNRSDAFYKRFISKEMNFDGLDELLKMGCTSEENDTDIDGNFLTILKNQSPSHIGRHRLSRGALLFDALDKQPDIIIFDNYMDLSAKLVSVPEVGDGNPFFIKLGRLGEAFSHCEVGEFLSPKDGAFYMSRIISHFSTLSPRSKLFFIHFPHNTYVGQEERIARTKEYETIFEHGGTRVIPCLTVRKAFQTQDKQHFQQLQYAAYAGMIYQSLN